MRTATVIALMLLPAVAGAQGTRSAALHGAVTTATGEPIADALVRVINTSNGQRWERMTGLVGRFQFEDLAVGGPYRIEVRAVGFGPQVGDGIMLTLGTRTRADIQLRPAAVQLPAVVSTARRREVLDASLSGPSTVLSSAEIARLPNVGRDFLRLTTLSPFAAYSPSSGGSPTGGIIMGGQNRSLNSFQIDGGGNLDQYTGRLPGRESLPRPVSLEALEAVQVLVAPFDIRHGGFAGGLLNAVTRSGSNTYLASAFGFVSGDALVGAGRSGERVQPFTTRQHGATIGGPIVRDRAHFFFAVDIQDRVVPDPGPLISDTIGGADSARIRIAHASAVRFQEILRLYDLDPGTLGPSQGTVPAKDLFAKVDIQLNVGHRLEISERLAVGARGGFVGRGTPGQYILTSASRRDPSTSSASRVIWTAALGRRWSNEMIGSHLRLRDACQPRADYPSIRVGVADVAGFPGELLAGTPNVCPSVFTQRSLELIDNLTLDLGAHTLTGGARLGLSRFTDDLLQGSAGLWQFANLDSLEVGSASRYERALAGQGRRNGVRFGVRQAALYAQDRWSVTSRVSVAVGLRADVTLLSDTVARNEALYLALGEDTRKVPHRTLAVSPRLSFNFDATGDGRTVVRGGSGLFAGAPPFVWLASAYRDDGTKELFLSCSGSDVPRFDPRDQPETCLSGAQGKPRLTVFDRGIRMPQSWKSSLGVDHRLPGEVAAVLDILFVRSIHDFYVTDANLAPSVSAASGEGDRPMYGTIASNGRASVARTSPAFGQVARFSNTSGDVSTTMTVQLRRRVRRADVGIWYAHMQSRDRMSLLNFPARANLENPPVDGSLENRRRGISYFEIPHRFMLHALAPLPFATRVSFAYSVSSGAPFTYVVRGDANADDIGAGLITNDAIYVPRDSGDIALANPAQWPSVNAFIDDQPCLRRDRGRILRRNGCRNPTSQRLNGRVTKAFAQGGPHAFELTLDAYNVLNLLNSNWGLTRVATTNPVQPILQLRGWDTARERGIYTLLADPRRLSDAESRWQLELSARYSYTGGSRQARRPSGREAD